MPDWNGARRLAMATSRRLALVFGVFLAVGAAAARAEDPPAEPAAPAEPEGPSPEDKARGYIGYTPDLIDPLSPEARKELGLPREKGWFVRGIVPRSPAVLGGLGRRDVLISSNGEPFPDTKGLDAKDEKAVEAFLKTWRERAKKVKPGDKVTLEVERDGKRQKIEAVAIDYDAYQALVQKAREDEVAVHVPDPAEAGAPETWSVDFETVPEGASQPEGFFTVSGLWEAFEDATKPKNHVLRQYGSGDPDALVVVTGKGRAAKDGTATVRFFLEEGMEAVSAGIVLRVKDDKNYVCARVDGVAKDLRILAVEAGTATKLASVEVGSPRLKTWHTLEVTFRDGSVKATYDGEKSAEGTDGSPAVGWCGLVTQADSVSAFDDFRVTPAAAK